VPFVALVVKAEERRFRASESAGHLRRRPCPYMVVKKSSTRGGQGHNGMAERVGAAAPRAYRQAQSAAHTNQRTRAAPQRARAVRLLRLSQNMGAGCRRQPCARSAGAMACSRPSRRHIAYAASHRGRGIHGGVALSPCHRTHRISLHEATATSNQSQKAAQTPVRRVYEAWSSEPGGPRQLAVGHQCMSRGGKIRAKVYRRQSTLKLGPWITKHSYRKGTIGPP
jgi:hypothetical protein